MKRDYIVSNQYFLNDRILDHMYLNQVEDSSGFKSFYTGTTSEYEFGDISQYQYNRKMGRYGYCGNRIDFHLINLTTKSSKFGVIVLYIAINLEDERIPLGGFVCDSPLCDNALTLTDQIKRVREQFMRMINKKYPANGPVRKTMRLYEICMDYVQISPESSYDSDTKFLVIPEQHTYYKNKLVCRINLYPEHNGVNAAGKIFVGQKPDWYENGMLCVASIESEKNNTGTVIFDRYCIPTYDAIHRAIEQTKSLSLQSFYDCTNVYEYKNKPHTNIKSHTDTATVLVGDYNFYDHHRVFHMNSDGNAEIIYEMIKGFDDLFDHGHRMYLREYRDLKKYGRSFGQIVSEITPEAATKYTLNKLVKVERYPVADPDNASLQKRDIENILSVVDLRSDEQDLFLELVYLDVVDQWFGNGKLIGVGVAPYFEEVYWDFDSSEIERIIDLFKKLNDGISTKLHQK